MSFWRFVLLAGVCGWGVPTGVLFSVLFWLASDPPPPFLELFLLSMIGFPLGGVGVGVAWWFEFRTQTSPPNQPVSFPPQRPAVAEQSERGPPLRILFESIGWESDDPVREVIDLAEPGQFQFLFMMFGAGNYIEARVVGENPEAIDAFRRLVTLGGFTPVTGSPPANARLYQPGDEMYPAPQPFVFICPTPDPTLVTGSLAAFPRGPDNATAR